MSKIEFETDENKRDEMMSNWFWHYGTYIDKNGKEHPFSVCEMSDGLTDFTTFELTWVEDTPENAEEAEKEVLENEYFKGNI
jgi:hypothetical protein